MSLLETIQRAYSEGDEEGCLELVRQAVRDPGEEGDEVIRWIAQHDHLRSQITK